MPIQMNFVYFIFRLTKEQIILDWNETSEEALLEASNNPVAQDTSNNANKSALETAMGQFLYMNWSIVMTLMSLQLLFFLSLPCFCCLA